MISEERPQQGTKGKTIAIHFQMNCSHTGSLIILQTLSENRDIFKEASLNSAPMCVIYSRIPLDDFGRRSEPSIR